MYYKIEYNKNYQAFIIKYKKYKFLLWSTLGYSNLYGSVTEEYKFKTKEEAYKVIQEMILKEEKINKKTEKMKKLEETFTSKEFIKNNPERFI